MIKSIATIMICATLAGCNTASKNGLAVATTPDLPTLLASLAPSDDGVYYDEWFLYYQDGEPLIANRLSCYLLEDHIVVRECEHLPADRESNIYVNLFRRDGHYIGGRYWFSDLESLTPWLKCVRQGDQVLIYTQSLNDNTWVFKKERSVDIQGSMLPHVLRPLVLEYHHQLKNPAFVINTSSFYFGDTASNYSTRVYKVGQSEIVPGVDRDRNYTVYLVDEKWIDERDGTHKGWDGQRFAEYWYVGDERKFVLSYAAGRFTEKRVEPDEIPAELKPPKEFFDLKEIGGAIQE